MICNMIDDGNESYYRIHLCTRAEKIGIETTCFILDLWDIELKRLYNRFKTILRLTKKYHYTAFEAACERANFYNQISAPALRMILKYHLYDLPLSHDTDIWGQKFFDFMKNYKGYSFGSE